LALLVAFVGWRFVVNRTRSAFVKAHYTKREYRIPMRDGVKLFTQVYAPKDSSQSHPFLVMRTPFSVAPYGDEAYRRLLGPSESFDKAGYIFVFQDVRGRFQSEGQFVDMRPHREQPGDAEADESRDMTDTVDWLLKNVPRNNGHNPSFDEKMQHNTYDDFWQARDISPHLHGIHCPVLNVGGWFDAEDLAGTFRTYRAIAEQNPGLQNVLVMGPWLHGA